MVLPQHSGPLSLGSIPSSCAICPFGFQSKLPYGRFLSGYSGFPPVAITGLLYYIFLFVHIEGPSGKQSLYTE